MKKKKKLLNNFLAGLFFGAIAIFAITNCSLETKDHKNQSGEMKSIIYTCPMHPEIQKNEPGKCPICNMSLEKSKKPQEGSLQIEVSDLVKPTYEDILSTVELVKPLSKALPVLIKANGIISYDTQRFENISSRFSGRIETLYVKSAFQSVKVGEKLFDVYSPEMVTEQQNLIFLLNNDKNEEAIIQAGKQKLSLLGMSEIQINEVVATRKALLVFSVLSLFDGYVLGGDMSAPVKANDATDSMSSGKSNVSSTTGTMLKEGAYIEKGQTVFKLVNSEVVWAVLKIYEKDISFVKLNQKVELFSEGKIQPVFSGKVSFIEPIHASGDNWLNVRVHVTNDDKAFKIGQLIRGVITTEPQQGLWIPKTSILDLGMKKIVFVKEKLFQARAVEVGITVGTLTQVISGIDENTELALNAQYLTDSESFIKVKN